MYPNCIGKKYIHKKTFGIHAHFKADNGIDISNRGNKTTKTLNKIRYVMVIIQFHIQSIFHKAVFKNLFQDMIMQIGW